jgi:energy-coupling factor transporter ATP-binding protein EcfA2
MPGWVSPFTAVLSSFWTWIQNHPWHWIQDHPVLAASIGFLATFGKKVWEKLEPKAVDFVAGRLEHRAATMVAGYGRLYAKHLYYKHRTFDVKGFSTQGKFALELENVYVDLDVDPAAVGAISQDPIRLPKDGVGKRNILAWLAADSGRIHNFAIVGPPGSGKTTLLKHLALLLSPRRAPLRLTPVLLFLREHASAIGSNADTRLADLIESSLKDLPPPSGWFQSRLARGKCMIMLDGLDEVADPVLRRKVVTWVERQVEFLGANRFLVSSRPNGYRDNPLAGFTALEVLPFHRDQVEKFVRNWYLANEAVAHQKNDPGVHMEAQRGANELLERLRSAPTLQDLAVNPLLLTLIATVHRYRSQLPGRRVELFAEICDVFLGKRQQAKGLELDLTPAQKVRVLRVLAYEMMRREVREIKSDEAAKIIAETLKLVIPGCPPAVFLASIEDSSALVVQKESGMYGFAHLTFQEYLASFHVREEKLVEDLCDQVDRTWWHETARLYAAQADASPIVERCLAQERPSTEALLLAADCEREALQLRGDLRERLIRVTEGAVEDPSPVLRRQAAEYLLERRLREMDRISDDRFIDRSPVTNAEYQLFVDEFLVNRRYRFPDHWKDQRYAPGTARLPVLGLGKNDAKEFCGWLSRRKSGLWTYTLPDRSELPVGTEAAWPGMRFFAADEEETIPILPAQAIIDQIRADEKSTAPRAIVRFGLAAKCLDLELDHRVVLGRRDFVRDLERIRDRGSRSDIPRDIGRVRSYAREILVDLDRSLDRATTRDLDMGRGPDRALQLARARDLAREVAERPIELYAAADVLLNWLCVVELRAQGKLPVVEGLWIARTRRQSSPTSVAIGE